MTFLPFLRGHCNSRGRKKQIKKRFQDVVDDAFCTTSRFPTFRSILRLLYSKDAWLPQKDGTHSYPQLQAGPMAAAHGRVEVATGHGAGSGPQAGFLGKWREKLPEVSQCLNPPGES